MSKGDIVRAWKDAEYRASLSAEEQALLPEHPAGAIELADEELARAAGGITGYPNGSYGCCYTLQFTACPGSPCETVLQFTGCGGTAPLTQ